MLEIFVYGPSEQGFLDIDPNATLEMEGLSDMFDEDLSTGEFSLPIDVLWTARNRRILGFSERLENYRTTQNFWKCTVFENGFPEIVSAKITMLEKAGQFSYQRGKFSASISGAKGLLGSILKNKKLTDLWLNGPITWETKESREFATDVMKGQYPQYPYLKFAPVAIEEFFDSQRSDYDNEFLTHDTVNGLVSVGGTFFFARDNGLGGHSNPGDSEHIDYRTVPFFQMKFVLKKCFEEFGFTLTGALEDSTDFDELFIFNNYAIENYAITIKKDFNRIIIPKNHLPNILITDFIKSTLSLFNIFPTFPAPGEVKLFYRHSEINNKKVLSLNDVASKDFTAAPEDVNATGSGYKLNYTWDSNDSMYGDRVRDLTDKNLVATLGKTSDLDSLNIGRQLTTDDIVYVEADNLYYVVADSTVTPVVWEPFAERLDAFEVGDGERSLEINASTLCTYLEMNVAAGLMEKRPFVGCRQKGSYLNNKGVRVVNEFGLRFFFIRTDVIDGVEMPVSSNYNRNSDNQIIAPFSLAWRGSKGLADTFHQHWQELRQRSEIVKTTVRVNQKILQDIKNHNCFEIGGVLFLMFKQNRTIPLKSAMEIELIPL